MGSTANDETLQLWPFAAPVSQRVAIEKRRKGCGLSIKHIQPGTVSLELRFPQRRAGKGSDH